MASEPRVVTVPDDLTEGLEKDPVARKRFEKPSYSHKRRYVMHVEEAKKPETRARRVTKTIEMLRSDAS